MRPPRLPENDAARVAALRAYGLLGSADDEAFNALVRVASGICETPIALVTLIDDTRQWFLANHGLPGVTETAREVSFCGHAILTSELMVVEDAAKDERFADNPAVVDEPQIRFYAGYPLIDQEGFALGTLCVIDRKPRTLSAHQKDMLRELATAMVRLLEAKKIDNALFAAEMAAKSARADLSLLLNTVSVGVAYWDADLRNRFTNPVFLDWYGLRREDVEGRHARDILGEELLRARLPAMEAALRGEAQRFEGTMATSDGRKRHVAGTHTPDIRDGQVLGFVSTATDVTELTTALVTSEQRNALLALAEEVSEVGHWRIEISSDHLYWSPQVYRIHGRDPATFVPTLANGVDAYHPDDRERVSELVRRAVERQEPFAFDLRLVRADGTVRRVEARGRCEIDARTGATLAVVGVFQDVTERDALRERNARRERLVTTGTLASGVGHEINNPLTYVTANVQFALDELRAIAGTRPAGRMSEVLEVLAEAREGADRIGKIVHGLKAFVREDAPLSATDVHAAL
ncbi:MAG TPA: PAS domain-containing protein, partial [Labilithrix sp.]|nr:PAS domain-containing protein [Labilithrix sp.]